MIQCSFEVVIAKRVQQILIQLFDDYISRKHEVDNYG